MKLIYFLLIFIPLFLVINLGLASIIYKNIYLIPTFSISMTSNFSFPYYNQFKTLILPGSLAVVETSNSNLFNIYPSRPLFPANLFFADLFLSIAIGLTISSIIVGYIKQSVFYLIGLLFAGVIFFSFSIYLMSPVYPGDIICYQEPVLPSGYIICHQYVGMYNSTVIKVRLVYNNEIQYVNIKNVVGKIVLIIPSPVGAIFFVYKEVVSFMYDLYSIAITGNIPVSYNIQYIQVT